MLQLQGTAAAGGIPEKGAAAVAVSEATQGGVA